MKRFSLLLIFTVLVSQLGGCAYMYSRGTNVSEKIEELVKKDEYELALDTIRYIDKTHPQYAAIQKQREQVIAATKTFESNILDQGQRLTKQELWHEASRIYEYGQEKLPNSKKIQYAYKEFLHKRSQHLKQLEVKLLVSKGKSLSQTEEARKEIARVFPESSQAKKQLKQHYDEVELTAERLIACSEDAMQAKDLTLAKECLRLAKGLNPRKSLQKRIARLEKSYKKATHVEIKKQAPSINKYKKDLEKASSHEELANIQYKINQIYLRNKSNPELRNLKKELDKKVNLAVYKGIKMGSDQYSKGKLRDALSIWQAIEPLDPNNKKLKEYIHRAERVITKIESLSNQKDTVQPAKQGS